MIHKRFFLRMLALLGLALGVLILTMATLELAQAQAPPIVIVKEADQTVVSGSTVTFTIAVTNTGGVTLTNVTVSDTLALNCARVIHDLNPGAGTSYECTRTNVTAAFTNTATVTATSLVSGVVSYTDTASVDVINPAIEIVKTADPTVVYANDGVTYTYTVTNPGDDPLSNVSVSDDRCSPVNFVGADTNHDGLLDVSETWTYTCSTTISVDTINTAEARGTDSAGGTVTYTDTAFVHVVNPDISIVKTADPTAVYANDGVTYTYTVTNPGDDPLSNVSVSDDRCSPVTFVGGDTNHEGLLDVSETWTYTCSTTISVDTTNTAEARGTDSASGTVTYTDTAFVDVVNPDIGIVKTADPTVVYANDGVTYTYAVTNPGDDPLSNVSVSDDRCSPVTFVGGDTNYDGLLDVSETWTYTCSTTISVDTTNTAEARGTDSASGTVTYTDTAFVDVINPDIEIAKSPHAQIVRSNSTITYTYWITNTGDATLTNVSLSDDRLGVIELLPTRVTDGLQALYTFEEGNGTAVHDVSGVGAPLHLTVEDGAAVGWVPGGGLSINSSTIVASAGAATRIIDASRATDEISIEAWVMPANTTQSGPARMVTLSGGAVWRNFTLGQQGSSYDTRLRTTATSDNGIPSLTAGTVTISELSHVVYTRDASGVARFYVNGVEAGSRSDITGDFSNWDEGFRFGLANEFGADRAWQGELHLVAIYNRALSLGEVSTNLKAGSRAGSLTLLPGESITATATYTVAAGYAGPLVNVATATGRPPVGDPVSDTDTATVMVINPDIAIEKTADPTTIYPGDSVTYTYALTNPGDDPLSDVVVTDDECSPVSGPAEISGNGDDMLNPGEVWECTCTTTLDEDTTNTATARGTDSAGGTVSDTDTAFVDVLIPDIEITKTPDTQTVRSNSTVTFTITVTNTGEGILSNVTVSDALVPNCVRMIGDLSPGGSTSYECSRANATTDFTNSATVTGTPPVGDVVTDTDTALVDVINPAIEIAKTPDTQTVISGFSATFTIAVTNTGDVPLTNVTVSDALALNCVRVIGDLAPGGNTSYECTRANVTADFTNSATVTGTPPVGDDVTDTNTATVELDKTQACPAGMIAYWKLDETSGPYYDDFYDGHYGECAGDCPDQATGHINGGQAFNGSSTGIDVPVVPGDDSFNWGAHDSFSIEFWMKANSANSCSLSNEVIVGRDDSSSQLHWWVGIGCGSWANGGAAFILGDSDGGSDMRGVVGTTDLTDGSWHHIVAVRDGSANENRIHVDGTAEASKSATYSTGFDSLMAALNIGWSNLFHGYHFDGTVDEVALYDRALSANEIGQHYNEGLAGRWYCEAETFGPRIVSTPMTYAAVGRLYGYDVEAAGNPPPTYDLITYPGGMTIDPVTGLISWTPTPGQEGSHNVEVQASNSEGTDTQSFSIAVTESMIAHWKLDETSGTTYHDFYDGHDGECAGDCPTPAAGHVNGGQAFNGSSTGIDVPADEAFDWGAHDSFSIEFWMRRPGTPTGNEVIIGQDDSATDLHWWVGVGHWADNVAAFCLYETDGTGTCITGEKVVTGGDWHHILAVRDAEANEIRIYVDGVKEGSTPATYTHGFDSSTAALNIGWLNLSHGYHFEGIVDEVVLYDVALRNETPSPGENQIYLPIVLRN